MLMRRRARSPRWSRHLLCHFSELAFFGSLIEVGVSVDGLEHTSTPPAGSVFRHLAGMVSD